MTPIESMAWRTDEMLDYPYWKAAQYSFGQGTHHSIIIVFDSKKEQDDYLALLRDEQVKLTLMRVFNRPELFKQEKK